MTFEELFSWWPSRADFAAELGAGVWKVHKWWQRRCIPSGDWDDVIAAAKRKGKNLSAAQLLAMHRSRGRAQPTRASA